MSFNVGHVFRKGDTDLDQLLQAINELVPEGRRQGPAVVEEPVQAALDEHAQDELLAERHHHEANLRKIGPRDATAFVWEFNRHINRVSDIMHDMARRRLPDPPDGAGEDLR